VENSPPRKVALPGFVYDTTQHRLSDARDRPVALRPQTLSVLHALACQANQLVTKDALMREVWQDLVVTDDSLVQCIKELRRAIGDTGRRVVQTEPRRGYRLASSSVADTGLDGDDVERPFPQDIHYAIGAGGTRIAYAVCGEGQPLVRAAQWMTHLELEVHSLVFGRFLRRLMRRHRLLRYDGRGCGLSDRGLTAATIDDEVRDLEAVVDAAGLERFALLGRSQGAAVAIRYAALHPRRVTRLVVIGGQVRGALRRGDASSSMASVLAFCKVLEDGWGEANSALRQVWTSWAFPGATTDQQDDYNRMQRASCSPKDAATLNLMECGHDASTDLTCIRCPTLVLHNPDDALVPFEEGRLAASMIHGARLETFASRNHQPLPGEPAFDQVLHAIEAFLAEGRSSDASESFA
jgi:pimeloyl-ACP methyl ester carboxylesterase/DNA-binding winged helix-turn-helix (wHTH) protein